MHSILGEFNTTYNSVYKLYVVFT